MQRLYEALLHEDRGFLGQDWPPDHLRLCQHPHPLRPAHGAHRAEWRGQEYAFKSHPRRGAAWRESPLRRRERQAHGPSCHRLCAAVPALRCELADERHGHLHGLPDAAARLALLGQIPAPARPEEPRARARRAPHRPPPRRAVGRRAAARAPGARARPDA